MTMTITYARNSLTQDETQMLDDYRKSGNVNPFRAPEPSPASGVDLPLEEQGYYFFFEDFTVDGANMFCRWILEQNLKGRHEELTLIINSPGGDVNAAFAMIDAIKGSRIPVRTVGMGLIGSCGFMTFIAGHHRTLTPNTSILSHQFSWGSGGKYHELMAVRKEQDMTARRIMDHYVKCTGLDEELIATHLLPAHDVWLSAEEALELGVCDEIKSVY